MCIVALLRKNLFSECHPLLVTGCRESPEGCSEAEIPRSGGHFQNLLDSDLDAGTSPA